ncbi:MAG: DUF2336 domain-containing protein [Micropepsaceae bacterium]
MGIAQMQPLVDGTEKLLEVVRSMPPEKRRTLSVELAARSDAPPRLMRLLARDEIVIAEPVILESPVLTEDDFCTIAKFGTPAHVAKLRMRPGLPVKVRKLLDQHNSREAKLLEELRSGNKEAFRSTLVEIAGREAESALDALGKGIGEPLASACKSAGLSRAAYSSIVLLIDAARAPEKTESLLLAFEGSQYKSEMGETDQAA